VTTTTTIPTTTTTVTLEQGLSDYRQCLASAGVTIGEISIDGMGRPRMAEALAGLDLADRAVLDALETCGHHLSSGALRLDPDPELAELVQLELEEFAECLRSRGVDDFPDPRPEFDGVGAPYPVNRIPWNDPDLTSAVDVCSALLSR
jgi:hypothetical protein